MKTVMKALSILFIVGMAAAAMAEEKVVWCPKDGIGKTQTWKQKGTVEAADNVLKVTLTDAEWSGVGLNWEGYWPADAGVKAADYKFLVVELKVEGANAGDLQIALKDNKSKDSASVQVKKYFPDGKFPAEMSTIKIPVADLLTDKSKFETGIVWEIMLHCWKQEAKDIKATVGRIAFTKE